jgi:thiol-disulfide isomerase/thioredoxin
MKRALVVAVSGLLLLVGCSGKDAPEQGGTFQFVSPGGKTDIAYDPPSSRGTVSGLSGPSLTDPSKTVSLADFAHQVVVINIWAQWCGPCRGEVGYLQNVYQNSRARGVAFLGVDVRDDAEKAADFVADNDVTYPSIFDPSMRTLLALGGIPTAVVPTTLVLDRRHRVAQVFLRSVLATDLQPVVDRLAGERV